MSHQEVAAIAAVIVLLSTLYSSVGHGGGSGYLAALALFSVAPAVMKPTALTLNVMVSTIALFQFARAGHFSWRTFWPFAAASVPASYVCGRIQLPGTVFMPLVGGILVFAAWRLLETTRRHGRSGPQQTELHAPALPISLGVGGSLGALAGLTGVGGGIFLSPILILARWADAKRTAGVSAAFILVNSLAGLYGLYTTGSGQWPSALPLWAACAVTGGLAGSYLGSRKFDHRVLRRLLALVLLIAGGKLLTEW